MPARRPNRSHAHKTTQHKNTGFIRIISGRFKGKKLPVQDSQGLRPTTNRVKETLFNWLMFNVNGAKVLDCFAGSGSLGFEALSREAASVTLVEKTPQVAKQLKQNLQQITQSQHNTDLQAEVIEQDCLTFLNQCQNQFDLVFIDPPFRLGLAEKTCQLLIQNHLLSSDALIYVETESELKDIFWPANWQILKEKTAGQVCYRLFQVS
ncbi:16S rRNA (guanine(966)-N(2))-methyltransferase RsmD [Catenovulum sp. 2E275]|uniref:16S rRNA (guanine(966)-N(2))-methyltransferase RsmD n=1 Tax=Catenovulum sp. 2E275 TaxID=2980497 RepID=UPI0021D0EC29|nr:16S rRNA (guanine(966)-N(2))-methyltransferase RsmD [Catenovulum sp. 2E275]MCU4676602.1 16S rRNA (guanine(966)-N(2))-methyltransferase RsmD [Catenovulum sp. 2E275]